MNMGNEYQQETQYLEAERAEGIRELRASAEWNEQPVFVVGEDEKPACHSCHVFFDPYDMQSPNGEYLESCEARTLSGNFPKHLPEFAKKNPHAFCSAQCEQDAIDLNALEAIEISRMAQHGEFDEFPMSVELGSYAQ
jgi:hypothetical protein